MKVTVLGGSGVWPTARQPCAGFLVEHEGFPLLIDPGYATLPKLLERMGPELIDAVIVSHGHADHCADLHPLLRARALGGVVPAPLPIHALPGAVDPVLNLDGPGILDDAYVVHELLSSGHMAVGPFDVHTLPLPHFIPNVGMRLTAGGYTLSYTGDTGPTPDIVPLATGADVLLAEATYVDHVPTGSEHDLSSAKQAGETAVQADVGRLVLTHLWPVRIHKRQLRLRSAHITETSTLPIPDLSCAQALDGEVGRLHHAWAYGWTVACARRQARIAKKKRAAANAPTATSTPHTDGAS